MPDVFNKKTRSAVMSAIKSRGNRGTEMRLANLLRGSGIKGWRRHQNLLGKPDFVFRSERVILFVDGCFWTCVPSAWARAPTSNVKYLGPKDGT